MLSDSDEVQEERIVKRSSGAQLEWAVTATLKDWGLRSAAKGPLLVRTVSDSDTPGLETHVYG